jgi:hypothetical protein
MDRLPLRNPVVGAPPQWAGLPQVAPTEQDVYATKFLWHAMARQKGAVNRIYLTQMVSSNMVACAEGASVVQMSIIAFRLAS